MEPEIIELFEAYRSDTLSPEDKKALQERFDREPALRDEFSMFTMMVSAIEEKRKEELKHFIRSNTSIRAIRQPFYKTYFFYSAAAASLVLCLLSYFLVFKKLQDNKTDMATHEVNTENAQPVTPEQKPEPAVTPPEPAKTGTVAEDKPATAKQPEGIQDVGNSVAENEPITQRKVTSNANEADNNRGMAGNPEDVEVSGDKMVLDTFMNIARKIYIAKPKAYQTSPTDVYAIVTTGDARGLEVQFWVSPVNYNGYKLSAKLLVIYGKEDLQTATFQELNNLLYMKYHTDYFVLKPNEVFTQFTKVTDAKIVADLDYKLKNK